MIEDIFDKMVEKACAPLESSFCDWLVVWMKSSSRVYGDIVFQAGAMFQEAYELGFNEGRKNAQ